MIWAFQIGPRHADRVIGDGTDLARRERAMAVLIDRVVGIVLRSKFQPIRSSGFAVSPSWVEPSAQPPTLVDASTSVAVIMPSPLVSTILPGPWLTATPFTTAFRSLNVMTPSLSTSVRLGKHGRGDLGLIDPDVVVQVEVVVSDASVGVGDNHLVRARRHAPCPGDVDAPRRR